MVFWIDEFLCIHLHYFWICLRRWVRFVLNSQFVSLTSVKECIFRITHLWQFLLYSLVIVIWIFQKLGECSERLSAMHSTQLWRHWSAWSGAHRIAGCARWHCSQHPRLSAVSRPNKVIWQKPHWLLCETNDNSQHGAQRFLLGILTFWEHRLDFC